MALILQIETATTSCSVALSRDGNTIAVKELNERNAHASSVTLFIEDVMKAGNYSMKDLDAVSVSMGPGSYTGLRIGVSTAKGLCYALDIPLISVNTLTSMASKMQEQYQTREVLFCPMIDARRMEVYTAVFDKAVNVLQPVEAKIIDSDSFAELLDQNIVVFFGDGAPKCKDVLGANPNAVFVDDFINSAADMSKLAFEKFGQQQFEDVAYFEPYYLKDFIAGGKGL
ncbi:tRNA threonylcarbamoyladenosine biosynthesis protein TsaB [Arcticibacter tournemirensis]|uniref:tRNA (Adenosine(37)-N6)-threonylcarbamoyltransferase complex dimerization subunit type 1 TsaB n=1 Tax=Arcticibacter tournemirensis TaxID=699437 RepID=A0A5M9HB15_9SPHI|nr:tRNA (adenosine(37)-N6)-threonylcarbamoyltransferase complex dimerization subunit type 1 TsaB [Arcticibacter tournemirensis]KAA8484146.1 tRNA (adenosine(37)-N6)-threonylcarbamoyltransferase complex dimerization subunit type 1 TsaB [Arcticibacter tournemirensis]TQM51891.1 tRNA threonylcarbamoyladenosine biosynthesis protein TsaB [Arcticibacter tournemirensis]